MHFSEKITSLISLLLLTVLILTSCTQAGPTEQTQPQTEKTETEQTETEEVTTQPPVPEYEAVDADTLGVSSRAVFLVNTTTGQVLCEKNSTEQMPIASLTKIMTALLALEYQGGGRDYTFTAPLIDSLVEANAARAGFGEGEKVRLLDLIYAAMLPSGADGAYGIAMLVAGGTEEFVTLMNERAKSLGMNDTQFADPVGLNDSGYSTAQDVAKLLRAALCNSGFREIATTKEWVTAPTDVHPYGITLTSTVAAGLVNNGIDNPAIKGGKTGFTNQAGLCLATFAYMNGEEYILVTLGAGDGTNDPQLNFADAKIIYDAFGIK